MKKIIFISYFKHQLFLFENISIKLNKKYCTEILYRFKIIMLSLLTVLIPNPKNIKLNIKQINKYSREKLKIKPKKIPNNIYIPLLNLAAFILSKFYLRYFINKNPDLIIVWNGHRMIAAAAVEAAKNLNIEVLFLENGFFPNTLVIDNKGVNAKSSLCELDRKFYENLEINNKDLEGLKEQGIRKRELRKDKNINKIDEKIKLPEKFVFLPFQVHDDTQIILNSNYIRNMRQFLDNIYINIDNYNQNNNSNIYIVVKEHPSDNGKIDYTDLKKEYKNKKVVFLKKYNTDELIQKSLCVITINSSVGIEAIFRHKKVITLGEAFFNIDGLVEHANNSDEIYEKLSQTLYSDINEKLMDKFIYFLRYKYLIEYDKNKKDISNIANRIIEHLEDK